MASPDPPPEAPVDAPQFARAEFRLALPDSNAFFVRALAYGFTAAVVGLVIYSAVGIITGLEIGYVSLLVGFIVGKAVLFGAAGRRGRRYQVAAALLTYVAVSMAAVPIAISQSLKPPAASVSVTPDEASTRTATSAPRSDAAEGVPSPGRAVAFLLVTGLASPLLGLASSPMRGLIGLVILFVGMQIAWRMTGAIRHEVVRRQ